MRRRDSGRPAGPTIAIVGLGPTGIAIGRALGRMRTDYTIVAHDRAAARVRAALRAGAADTGEWNLIKTVETADLVFLAEPVEQQVETLALVADHLRPEALAVGVARRLVPLVAAAEATLPSNVSFIASDVVPARDADDGAAPGSDADPRSAIDADAIGPLAGATWCLAPGRGATDEAVQVMSRLAAAAGAKAHFIDPAEHDALVSGAAGLPRIAFAALARVIARSPSAQDLRRLVDPAVRDILGTVDPEAADDLVADPGVLPWLDKLASEIDRIRAGLAAGDTAALRALLDEADAVRAAWSDLPDVDRGAVRGPDLSDVGGARQLLFGRRRSRSEGGRPDGGRTP